VSPLKLNDKFTKFETLLFQQKMINLSESELDEIYIESFWNNMKQY